MYTSLEGNHLISINEFLDPNSLTKLTILGRNIKLATLIMVRYNNIKYLSIIISKCHPATM